MRRMRVEYWKDLSGMPHSDCWLVNGKFVVVRTDGQYWCDCHHRVLDECRHVSAASAWEQEQQAMRDWGSE